MERPQASELPFSSHNEFSVQRGLSPAVYAAWWERTPVGNQERDDAEDHDNDTRAFGDTGIKRDPYERHIGIARHPEDQQPDPEREGKGSNQEGEFHQYPSGVLRPGAFAHQHIEH